MDPNAALERLIRLCGEGRWAEAVDQHRALAEWLYKGGFEPEEMKDSETVRNLFWLAESLLPMY